VFETTDENEERSMITPQSLDDRRLKELLEVLIEWINDELAQHRIIVKNIEEDLYDGQVLHKLIGEYYFPPSNELTFTQHIFFCRNLDRRAN
jgi:hypothetical protein